jgi:hypothetical protein
MSATISFEGCSYETQMDYEDLRAKHWLALESEECYEVLLADGTFARRGVPVRLLINPHKVASIREAHS